MANTENNSDKQPPKPLRSSVTLAELLETGAAPANIAAYVLTEIANALKDEHDNKALHNDLRPANIFVSKEGLVKITGFSKVVIGTKSVEKSPEAPGGMAYASPEQVLGVDLIPSSDMFSLGAILYEMLAGSIAFKGASTEEIQDHILNLDPVSDLHGDDAIPAQLRRICQQLLKKKPEQRYQDCDVLIADLAAFKNSRGQGAVATAAEMKSYLTDPEAYIRKMRDKPVSLRTREPRPNREPKAKAETPEDKSVRRGTFNITRLLSIVGLLVLLFGGLSFAGSFFFSKGGSFGAQNNRNKPAGPNTASSGTVNARSGKASGDATPVQSKGRAAQGAMPIPLPIGPAPMVVVTEKDGASDTPDRDSTVAPTPKSDPVAIDTVILLADPNTAAGKMMIEATPWAVVYLDTDSVGVTPLPLVVGPGTYTISLKHPDFPPFETAIDVVPGRETPFKVSLWSFVGVVDITATHGAEVYIDGAYRTENPFILKPGKHQVTLTHPTLGTFEQLFEVAAGEKKSLSYDLNGLK